MDYTGPVEIDAGGLLTRDGDGDRELLLICRRRYGDWTLPKGHLEANETLEAAAEREVREETGITVRTIEYAGAMAYEKDGRIKPVVYFWVEPVEPAVPPQAGIDSTAWIPLHEAIDRMSHCKEREFVASILPPASKAQRQNSRRTRWGTQWRIFVGGRGVRSRRIAVQVTLHEIDLAALERRAQPENDTVPQPWMTSARMALRQARDYLEEHRIDDAWDALHASQRYALYGRTSEELSAQAEALRNEADEKLTGWRLQAVHDQLPSPPKTRRAHPSGAADATAAPELATQVDAAQRVMDEHSTNVYTRLRLVGLRLVVGSILLIMLLLAMWIAVSVNVFGPAKPPLVLRDGSVFAGVVALGALGAALSFTLASAHSAPSRRLYELTTARVALPLGRLAVGASAAVVVVAAVQIGVLNLGSPWSVLIAVPAGFSERALDRVIEGLETAAGKP